MKTGYLIHYGELALKGKNRPFFEERLVANMARALVGLSGVERPQRLFGRVFLGSDPLENSVEIEKRLKKIFGISNFAKASLVNAGIDDIKAVVTKELTNQPPFQTFRVRARRADKVFPLDSKQIEFEIGAFVKEQTHAAVNLTKADLTIYVEVLAKKALVYFDKIAGSGGLPCGVSGRVACLISGGIDSPVAAWQMAKRGAKNIFVHFHSYPQTDLASQENVREIVKQLTEWQMNAKLYLVPLLEIQKEIVAQCPEKLRVILYRRMMLRLAEEIAKTENALALVTGENLGQVASQTLENIAAISQVVSLPILRPLIGLDKQEIIDLAQQLGTYEISTRPYQDCCSLFVPKHPETKAKIEDVEAAEKRIAVSPLVEEALSKTTSESFLFPN